MNGRGSNNPVGRRAFLRYTAGLFAVAGGIAFLFTRKKEPKKLVIIEESPDLKNGHLLRQPGAVDRFPRGTTSHSPVIIVGGGIAALAAGRKLSKAGLYDYTILEMEDQAGGNAAGSSMEGVKYPLGAHYLTIPNQHNTDLIQFLDECGMVREKNDTGIYYHEEYIVHAPAEQCYYHGKWHKGLIPLDYLSAVEKAQLKMLEEIIAGHNQELLLNIPFEPAKLTPALLELDQVSFLHFLDKKGISAENVIRYVDYCCRDDFGGGAEHVSALAGLHYFCSRRPHFLNPAEVDYLSWPEGNSFMARELLKQNKGTLKTGALVVSVARKTEHFEVQYLQDGRINTITGDHVLLDVPHFVADRVVHDEKFKKIPEELKVYYPWVMLTLLVNNQEGHYDHVFNWDNIHFASDSLGYINSSHQVLNLTKGKIALTYYKAFKGDQHTERGKLYRSTVEDLAEMAMDELEKMVPGIKNDIEQISVCRRGHGMICPVPGMFTYLHGHDVSDTGVRSLYRIHTDASGYSVFEEAFANGNKIAVKIIDEKRSPV